MKAIVRQIHSPDIDMATEQVEDPTDFGLLLQLMVGPSDWRGAESFDVMVCTPTWLSRLVREQGPVIGRHYLVVETYNENQIADYLTGRVESLEADTWQELAEKVGRLGKWEFEDYSNT